MKSVWIMVMLVLGCLKGFSQSQEAQQLLLNVEKLTQFKQILSNMKKGYEILSQGYTAIKNISEGNFSLHKVFLDGLLEVSPTVKRYKRIADIVDYQIRLVSEYKSAFKRFKQGGLFNDKEIEYLGNVYGQLFNRSVKNLDDLLTVITSSKLRMSDDERLSAIDKIYADMQDKLMFLRSFNNSNTVLSIQRAKEARDVKQLEGIYGIK